MKSIAMTAKKAGTCTTCNGPIVVGQRIYWARGQGARHHDCRTAKLSATLCTNCGGSGVLWAGRPCRACDGTGQRKMQEFAGLTPEQRHPAPQHDPMGVDRAYEDDCARQCGL